VLLVAMGVFGADAGWPSVIATAIMGGLERDRFRLTRIPPAGSS
jgi:hypothetical protein